MEASTEAMEEKNGGLVYLANTPGLQPGANGSNPLSSTKNIRVVSLMVEPRFYTAMTAVQFCHDLPS